MKKLNLFFLVIVIALASCSQGQNVNRERQWSSFRGYYANGILDDANLPDTWNGEDMTNIKWKIDVPGLALSSPVIWGDRLFITSAISEQDTSGLRTLFSGDVTPVSDDSEHEWKVYCINKHTGETIWERTSFTGIPEMKRHPMSTHANTTLATDGSHVVAFFGSEGLYCYDMDGNLLWDKDFGTLKSVFFVSEGAEWEFASSPIIHDGKVIVQCDVFENSFVAALDIETGDEIWRAERDEYPGWSTPNIYKYNGKDYVIVNGYKHRGAYDFKTGDEVWKMSGGGDIPIPSPIVSDELLYFNSAHGRSSPVLAIKKDASGDITLNEGDTTNTGVKWSHPRGGSYLQTMLLYNGYLYSVQFNGQVTCMDAGNGEIIFREKIGKADSFLSSPVASDGKVFITDVKGIVYAIAAGPEFNIMGKMPLGDVCMTTPAITDGIIFFRTEKYLIAVSEN